MQIPRWSGGSRPSGHDALDEYKSSTQRLSFDLFSFIQSLSCPSLSLCSLSFNPPTHFPHFTEDSVLRMFPMSGKLVIALASLVPTVLGGGIVSDPSVFASKPFDYIVVGGQPRSVPFGIGYQLTHALPPSRWNCWLGRCCPTL